MLRPATPCSPRCALPARRRSTSSARCRTWRCRRCSTRPRRTASSYYDRLHFLPEIGDEFVDALVAGFERAPTPQAHVMTAWLGGAIDRVEPGETAFGHRGARALTWIIGASGDEPVDAVADWVRSAVGRRPSGSPPAGST